MRSKSILIVALVLTATNLCHAAYEFIPLGTLPDAPESRATSINNNGQIVGSGSGSILFDSTGNGNNIKLGTLRAKAINNAGQIVGRDDFGGHFPTLFDPTGNFNNINLGTVGSQPGDGSSHGEALSINDNGMIVGESKNASYISRATLFDPTGNGNNIDLNTLISPSLNWELRTANCINDNGWIVGEGINPDGNKEAFLLTPEPTTLLLLGLGILMLRKRKQ